MNDRFCWETRPLAAAENVVAGASWRFTVLTPGLLRMEYAPGGCFEDRASQLAFFRDMPACSFCVSEQGDRTVIRTELLQLEYRKDAPFREDTLQIRLLTEPGTLWRFGEEFETLGGTARTLDGIDGRRPLDPGVCSRNGFSVVDDSRSLLLEPDGWFGLRQEGTQDLYFFGYGWDYPGAVRALYRLTGAPSLLPAYALGNWWSRYYAYTQEEYLALMDKFQQNQIPFSVGVVDMDWHTTQIPEEKRDPHPKLGNGWTGYTWNRKLFPDPPEFLRQLHQRGLKVALNLHPHAGTCCHEDQYEAMARANGIDPASQQRVPLNVLSRRHMESYFDILHHPYEEDGVDFWWMDWQQGTNYWWIHEPNEPGQYQEPLERMDPLWLLNHLHTLDISRGGLRPMFFSRYAGLGSHRYSIGFSGDTIITWDSLRFQPEFTATAANCGYCWWSHDIGGHMLGIQDDELFVRWLQLGVLSPINRIHSSKDEFLLKDPLTYPPQIARILVQWLRLRHRLFPYLYTMNHRCHRELTPLVRPMYHTHPRCHDAYRVPNQYWFGSELIVAPVTEAAQPGTELGRAEVWLPQGSWFDAFTGQHYASRSGRLLEVFRSLDRAPVFAKAGAIVPLDAADGQDGRLGPGENIQLLIFPGADNEFVLYEDAGDGFDTLHSACTRIRLDWGENPRLTVEPAQGDISLLPARRVWEIGLRGFHEDIAVPGMETRREACSNTTWVKITAPTGEGFSFSLSGQTLLHDNSDAVDRCREIIRRCRMSYSDKENLIALITGTRYRTLGGKLCGIRGTALPGVKALAEQMTLTEDPYTGPQYLPVQGKTGKQQP